MKQFVEITCVLSGPDAKLFTDIVNIGIDSHLEGFTKSKFLRRNSRLVLNFHVSELEILVRRLEQKAYDKSGELVNESAYNWANDIRDLPEFKDNYHGN